MEILGIRLETFEKFKKFGVCWRKEAFSSWDCLEDKISWSIMHIEYTEGSDWPWFFMVSLFWSSAYQSIPQKAGGGRSNQRIGHLWTPQKLTQLDYIESQHGWLCTLSAFDRPSLSSSRRRVIPVPSDPTIARSARIYAALAATVVCGQVTYPTGREPEERLCTDLDFLWPSLNIVRGRDLFHFVPPRLEILTARVWSRQDWAATPLAGLVFEPLTIKRPAGSLSFLFSLWKMGKMFGNPAIILGQTDYEENTRQLKTNGQKTWNQKYLAK